MDPTDNLCSTCDQLGTAAVAWGHGTQATAPRDTQGPLTHGKTVSESEPPDTSLTNTLQRKKLRHGQAELLTQVTQLQVVGEHHTLGSGPQSCQDGTVREVALCSTKGWQELPGGRGKALQGRKQQEPSRVQSPRGGEGAGGKCWKSAQRGRQVRTAAGLNITWKVTSRVKQSGPRAHVLYSWACATHRPAPNSRAEPVSHPASKQLLSSGNASCADFAPGFTVPVLPWSLLRPDFQIHLLQNRISLCCVNFYKAVLNNSGNKGGM